MQQEIQQMLFTLKLQNVSAKKIEEDLGFSNGVLAKAAKGIVGISPARFELFKQYYNVNVIDDRTNSLINVSRGRDKDGANNDELIIKLKETEVKKDIGLSKHQLEIRKKKLGF